MLRPLAVLWLAVAGTPDERRHTDAAATPPRQAELTVWAAQRGFRPVAPVAAPAPAYDRALVQHVEHLLEEARTLTPASPAAFAELDRLLAAHPDLPQAAWLAAERYALEASQVAQAAAADPTIASRLRLQASALEGERAVAFGTPPPPGEAQALPEPFVVVGARPEDELLIDGHALCDGPPLMAGRHHVQWFRAGARVWAGWVEVGSPPRLELSDPTPACSRLDLVATRAAPRAPLPGPGVRCGTWAVASPDRDGGLRVALCRGSECGAWERTESARSAQAGAHSRAPDAPQSRWPVWVTWSAVGFGAAAATALLLWQVGAFDHSGPRTQFTFTGPAAAAAFHF